MARVRVAVSMAAPSPAPSQHGRNPLAIGWNVTGITAPRAFRSPGRRRTVRAMEFLILGPLEVSDDGAIKLALGGPKQRAVLAHLILRANRGLPATC